MAGVEGTRMMKMILLPPLPRHTHAHAHTQGEEQTTHLRAAGATPLGKVFITHSVSVNRVTVD